MQQQTAVDWLENELSKYDIHKPISLSNWDTLKQLVAQAKAMEKEQRIKDYNVGYDDAQCNHINDAENYVNEIDYLQSRIDEIDSKIKAKQNSIADMLINGDLNNK
jgi:predicted phosphatase